MARGDASIVRHSERDASSQWNDKIGMQHLSFSQNAWSTLDCLRTVPPLRTTALCHNVMQTPRDLPPFPLLWPPTLYAQREQQPHCKVSLSCGNDWECTSVRLRLCPWWPEALALRITSASHDASAFLIAFLISQVACSLDPPRIFSLLNP